MLSVDNIDLHYGAARALHEVCLTATAGEVTCILGRNGVGKTSLVRAIMGLQPISQGTIRLGDVRIDSMKPHQRARQGIAVVPQGREIFPFLTVRENLETGFAPVKAADRSIPEEVLTLFPVLKDMMERKGGDLSGGQQQQLAIGRALVTRPRVLIMDEPTEGIQPSIIKDIGAAIAFLRDRGSMAIVLVEQYFDFAKELADSFLVLDRGQEVASGRRADLVEADLRRHLTV